MRQYLLQWTAPVNIPVGRDTDIFIELLPVYLRWDIDTFFKLRHLTSV